jgi:hypothetical protein
MAGSREQDVTDLHSVTNLYTRVESPSRVISSGDFADELKRQGAESAARASDSKRRDFDVGHASGPIESGSPNGFRTLPGSSVGAHVEMGAQSSAPAAPDLLTMDQVLSARVFGFHLQGAPYLSECVGVPTNQVVHPESVATTDCTAASRPDMQADFETDSIQEASYAPGRKEASGSVGCGQDSMQLDSRHVDAAETVPSVEEVTVMEDAYWSERSLRIITQDDGKKIILLRDYSLSKDQADELASRLMEHMKEQGATPDEVIWNGHSIWSSDEQG